MEPSLALGPLAPRGFTLVEMIVVLAIIVVITGVVINGQSTYNQSILLTDTAYTVAFSVRQAQSLGLASRGAGAVTDAGYGVYFQPGETYTIFADLGGGRLSGSDVWCSAGTPGTPEARPGNCVYDPGTDQIVQTYTFSRGFTISSVCGKLSGGAACAPISSLHVVFRRPETTAIMVGPTGQYVCSEIHVRAPTGGVTRIVRVSQLGEISVGQSCP